MSVPREGSMLNKVWGRPLKACFPNESEIRILFLVHEYDARICLSSDHSQIYGAAKF